MPNIPQANLFGIADPAVLSAFQQMQNAVNTLGTTASADTTDSRIKALYAEIETLRREIRDLSAARKSSTSGSDFYYDDNGNLVTDKSLTVKGYVVSALDKTGASGISSEGFITTEKTMLAGSLQYKDTVGFADVREKIESIEERFDNPAWGVWADFSADRARLDALESRVSALESP